MSSCFQIAAEMKSALLEDRIADLSMVFLRNGAYPPDLAWDPAPGHFEDGRLGQLCDYWQTKANGAPAAFWKAIDPTELRFILGYVMLLDVLDGGADFRYRLYGSLIAERFGRDVTGKTVRDFGDAEYIVNFFLATYQAVTEARRPLLSTHYPRPESQTASWSRLILPLVDETGAISRLLVGQIPGEWRPRAPGTNPPAF
ncbi:PAS domain-containing protein [Nisaea sediminum]|uniref:PAS domain-containing protein n=1 Tax=Nisaea sediminum TaxID=2775867 RepID=UPI0018677D46|nr:PAS domain-containing protein [Nisaea sediminum]